MGVVEIVLLIAGSIIFILSFVIPIQKEKVSEETKQLAKEEIKELVSTEWQETKSEITDMVDETTNEAVDKAERALERLSNEKIMAVGEYSDTVLAEINRNHNEVMFLYDMLNEKHKQIVNTVGQVQKTVKSAENTVKEQKEIINEGKPVQPKAGKLPKNEEQVKNGMKQIEAVRPDISFIAGSEGTVRNSNDKILKLHHAGKSNVAIAQELGLGVGEVKLVIDLFEGM